MLTKQNNNVILLENTLKYENTCIIQISVQHNGIFPESATHKPHQVTPWFNAEIRITLLNNMPWLRMI